MEWQQDQVLAGTGAFLADIGERAADISGHVLSLKNRGNTIKDIIV